MNSRPILFLNLSSTQFGGGEVYLLNILRHMRSRVPILVGCAEENSVMVERLKHLAIPYRTFSLSYRKLLPTVMQLLDWARDENVALVHANGRRSQLFAAPLAAALRIPLVAADLVVNLSWTGSPLSVLLNLMAACINRVLVQPWTSRRVVLCDYMRRQCTGFLGIRNRSVETIYNGVDVEYFHPQPADSSLSSTLGFPDNAEIVGCSARFIHHKGQHLLIEAVAELIAKGRKELYLLLIGEGPHEARLREQAKLLGISERIRWVPFPPDIRPLYALCQVVVLPSREEGLPTALLQAMAMARPTIGTAVQGIPEVIIDSESGKLFFPWQVEPLARALDAFLEMNPTQRAEWGNSGRKLVLKKFSLETMLQRLEALYLRLLRGD